MKSRVLTVVVVGVAAALSLTAPAQAAPEVRVVYSSDTYVTTRFAVHEADLAFLACTTVNQVRIGRSEALPWPGCSSRVEDGGGLAYSRDGSVIARTITVRHTVSGPQPVVDARLYRVRGEEYLASTDVGANEEIANPDGKVRYGTRSANRCVTRALGADARYRGRIDSRLRSVAAGPSGSFYVADQDGNTVYRVDAAGRLSALAVLPPVDVTVSEDLAKRSGWPSCVVGTTVAFEAAPAEVEVAADGTVYVAGMPTLPSGKTAATSVIYAISPKTEKVSVLKQRYVGTVDLAAGTSGRLFVAHPGSGRISVIAKGKSATYVTLPRVLSVETDSRGRLYAVREAGADPRKTPGTVVRIG